MRKPLVNLSFKLCKGALAGIIGRSAASSWDTLDTTRLQKSSRILVSGLDLSQIWRSKVGVVFLLGVLCGPSSPAQPEQPLVMTHGFAHTSFLPATDMHQHPSCWTSTVMCRDVSSCFSYLYWKSLKQQQQQKLFGKDLAPPNRTVSIWSRPVCAHHVAVDQLQHLKAIYSTAAVLPAQKLSQIKVSATEATNTKHLKWNKNHGGKPKWDRSTYVCFSTMMVYRYSECLLVWKSWMWISSAPRH